MEGQLEHEILGIHEILRCCSLLDITMAGIYIDGTLEAFTIGATTLWNRWPSYTLRKPILR